MTLLLEVRRARNSTGQAPPPRGATGPELYGPASRPVGARRRPDARVGPAADGAPAALRPPPRRGPHAAPDLRRRADGLRLVAAGRGRRAVGARGPPAAGREPGAAAAGGGAAIDPPGRRRRAPADAPAHAPALPRRAP